MREGNRIGAIDTAKGIGILLVIIGHTLYSDNPIRIFIYTFHMPMFFILTGAVMKNPGDRQKSILKDFLEERKLIVSYYFYSISLIIFDIVLHCLGRSKVDFNELDWYIYQTLTFYGISVLWFLATLILAKVLVKQICRRFSKGIYRLMAGSIFYAAAGIFSSHIQWLDAEKYKLIYYPLVALLRVVSVAIYILLGYTASEKMKGYASKKNRGGVRQLLQYSLCCSC